MGKSSAKIIHFSPSKAEAPPKLSRAEIMKKVWATRKANEAKRKRAAKRKKPARLTVADVKEMAAEASEVLTPRSEARPGFLTATERDFADVNSGAGTSRQYSRVMQATGGPDPIAIATKAIMVEARKKDAEQAISQRLHQMVGTARYEGEKTADDRATDTARQVARIHMERVVAGFIAEVERAMTHHRGLPPDMVWTINSYTVCRIIDALNEAGYTAKGIRPQPVTNRD